MAATRPSLGFRLLAQAATAGADWNAAHEPLLTIPETATPEAADLNPEFQQSQAEPFKTIGTIRIVNGAPAFPVVAAARDDSGKPLGYLVRWRKLAGTAEARKQLT